MTGITENRNFDLNTEKVLEGWETCHWTKPGTGTFSQRRMTSTRTQPQFQAK
jgi:hypothetical protein